MAHSPRILLVDAEDVVPGVTKVNLRGRLDAAGVQAVEAIFARLAQSQEHLLVDLSRVSFIASAGLRTLIVGARSIAARGGRMAILQPVPSVESVLISSGTDQVIPVFQTLADAVCAVCAFDGEMDDLPEKSLAFSVDVERTQGGIARIGAWVDELCILLNLSQRTEYALRLCLEEVATHIVAHGHPEPGTTADRLILRLIADTARLSVTVQDWCAAYNPLVDAATPGAAKPQGEHAPGEHALSEHALGMNLMRQHARDLAWSRVGGCNRLALTISR